MTAPVPFTIAVPDAVLDDLRQRLDRTLWPVTPAPPDGGDWRLGIPPAFLRRVVAHWRHGYDWRRFEARLNALPNFRAEVEGLGLHFLHLRGSGQRPLPLLLTHGWPGSVAEFVHIVEPLAHPERFGGRAEDGFDVIVPSLPGYGWSDAPPKPLAPRDVARLWNRLMTEVLGYPDYVAQGGDWGAIVTTWLARDHPDRLRALHLNMLGTMVARGPGDPPVTAEEAAWVAAAKARNLEEDGYQHIQGTKPVTLSYGLTDSPVGLAAWIIEKFQGWSVRGDADPPFTLDQLLDNVMVYWVTRSIGSSTWLYTALRRPDAMRLEPGRRVEVPTGLLLFPNDLLPPPPPSWTERAYNVVHRRYMPAGGHFAALERGDELVDDVRTFFRAVRGPRA
jgi:microsomal epoxide hydrolase